MARSNLKSRISPAAGLNPAARTASANGTGIDLKGYNGCVVAFLFGAWTDGSHTPKLQESADNATFTDVAAADQDGTLAAVTSAAGQNAVQLVGYKGNLRYIRPVVTVAGATTGAVSAATAIRNSRRHG